MAGHEWAGKFTKNGYVFGRQCCIQTFESCQLTECSGTRPGADARQRDCVAQLQHLSMTTRHASVHHASALAGQHVRMIAWQQVSATPRQHISVKTDITSASLHVRVAPPRWQHHNAQHANMTPC